MEQNATFKDALVLTGGGTGGHFYPAVALAEGARARWPERPILFVGAQRGIEARKLPESPWPHLLLDVEGLMGRAPLGLLRALWKLAAARRTLVRLWRQERPAAVIGTGGYGAAPALLAAKALGIPYFLHESNAAPGALVSRLAPGARRVWLGMAAAESQLKGAACMVAGTPVRKSFLRPFTSLEELGPPFRLLVLGGSGGARPLNEAVLAAAPSLLERFPDWELLHQTGPAEHARLQGVSHHTRHLMVPFLEDMDQILEQSSLVVSRSGASTCAELLACGRPSVLVPFPQAAGDHQRINARAMEAHGVAKVVEQGDRMVDRLTDAMSALMADASLRSELCKPELNQAVGSCLDDLTATLA